MKLRTKYWLVALLIVVWAFAQVTPAMADDSEQPNILFIFADDMCYDVIAATGHEEIKTPNLDSLVQNGTVFSNVYNMGAWNGAVCIASRTMLNTGMYVWRAHDANLPSLADRKMSWSQLMHNAGYETYMTGKWHVGGLKTRKVFDHVKHERPGMPRATPEGYVRPIEGQPDKWSPSDPKFGGFWKGGKHWSEVVADDSETFLKQAGSSEKPFFMYLAFNAPHDPRQSPQKFVDMYPPEKVQVPVNFLPMYPHKQEMGCYGVKMAKDGTPERILRDENLAPFPRTEYAVRVNRQEYYALITHMDVQIGRILAALDATGKRNNTYIFFTADHGLACGQHGLLGKQNMYDHSMRVPFIVVGPDVPANERRTQPIYMQDVMPTTLELAHAEKPNHVEFDSLVPLMKDQKHPANESALYGCYLAKLQRMIRVDDWKLIAYPEAKVLKLFNLKEDPHEMNDLSQLPEHQERLDKLLDQLLDLQGKMDDPLDLRAVYIRKVVAQ